MSAFDEMFHNEIYEQQYHQQYPQKPAEYKLAYEIAKADVEILKALLAEKERELQAARAEYNRMYNSLTKEIARAK